MRLANLVHVETQTDETMPELVYVDREKLVIVEGKRDAVYEARSVQVSQVQ
jgi:hypothetical protein